jgi:hypothetical protein
MSAPSLSFDNTNPVQSYNYSSPRLPGGTAAASTMCPGF